ncbi:MAG: hypothetical protein AAF441_12580 [Pseudomonadota bacterium]
MRTLALAALAAAAVSLSPANATEDALEGTPKLEAEQIKELFPGNYAAKVAGYDMLITGSTDGKLRGRAFSRQDRGRWWVEENALCVAWSNWTEGKPMCGEITIEGDWYFSQNEKGEGMKFRKVEALAIKSAARKRIQSDR